MQLESQHRIIQKGVAVRAAVFGINDGLVSNASLILGVAGASANTSIIVLSGIAGLCAGAFSMAAGEYISMRSQRELFENQIGLERAELEQYPEEEAAELSLIYQARGLSKLDADDFAHKMLLNKELGLNTLVREELGLNPDDLGSPWVAAFSSFITFAIGGAIPLVPFLFQISTNLSLYIAMVLTGMSLFLVGVVLSLFTGRNAFYSGLRMLCIGALAGSITFGIGKIVGVNIH
jgi:VIT1/CCC1 family predicted Fe2+/Mn2+ transporter